MSAEELLKAHLLRNHCLWLDLAFADSIQHLFEITSLVRGDTLILAFAEGDDVWIDRSWLLPDRDVAAGEISRGRSIYVA